MFHTLLLTFRSQCLFRSLAFERKKQQLKLVRGIVLKLLFFILIWPSLKSYLARRLYEGELSAQRGLTNMAAVLRLCRNL